jgi:hypothetical protein
MFLLMSAVASAGPLSLQWDPSRDPGVTGYVVMFGTQSGVYSNQYDVGNRTAFQIPAMPPGRYFFVVRAYTADGITSDPSSELAADLQTLAPEVSERTPEFAGPVGGDVLLYNSASGDWEIQTSAANGLQLLKNGTWSPGWTIKIGEFNGDNLADLFFYNASNGKWWRAIDLGGGRFDFFGGTWITGADITVLDLNGDGRSDVFGYNATTGQWFAARTAGGPDFDYRFSGVWKPGWSVYAADFNGDARADLFLYNRNGSGDPMSGLWYRVLTQRDGSFTFDGGAIRWAPDFDVLTGDFDGDGRTDLFLYRANGDYYVVRFGPTGPVYRGDRWRTGWTIRRGDFNGDGISDLFLYSAATGQWFTGVTQLDGSFWFEGGVWRTGWDVSVTDFDYDGRSDVLLYNSSTGAAYQCLTRGSGVFELRAQTLSTGMAVVGR